MRLGGVILCGGQSTRMGRPKAFLPFEGKSMLECVVQRLQAATTEMVVVAAAGQELPKLPDACRIIRDESPLLGPLEGLRVGLSALRATCNAAFVTGCDTPLLVPEVIVFLSNELGDSEAVVVVEAGRPHPLTAIYKTSLTNLAAELLAGGESRLQSLLESAKAKFVDAEQLRSYDPDLATLRNLNFPEEYQRALEGLFCEKVIRSY